MKDHPLNSYITELNPVTPTLYRQKLRDILQKICLLGLWRGKFFEYAAFYGGTALRMLYGLDRFSEDLDFSLMISKPDFNLAKYIGFVEQELIAWGISAQVELVKKENSDIESAFIKTNTLQTMLNMQVPPAISRRFHRNEVSKVKFEVDPYPPCDFTSEFKYILEPIPFSVRTMNPADLFAGKMHAILARNWKNRVKGRDWYDLIWFIKKEIILDLPHLEARLKQSGHLAENRVINKELLDKMLKKRISEVDFEQAKFDVLPFVQRTDILTNWSKELFISIIEKINVKK